MTRIMQINSVYGVGSTGRLTRDLHLGLREDGFDSSVLYGRGPQAHDAGVKRLCANLYGKAQSFASKVSGSPYGGCLLSTTKALRLIGSTKPDIVHLQCINEHFINVYRLLRWLCGAGIRTVLTLHADFMFTGNCGSALGCEEWRNGCCRCSDVKRATKSLMIDRTEENNRRLKNAYEGFGDRLSVVSVSSWQMNRAKASPMLAGFRHSVIENGVDASVFSPTDSRNLLSSYGLVDRIILLHVTAQFDSSPGHLKGGSYVIDIARRLSDLPVTIVVIGPYRTEEAIPDNVMLLGRIDDDSVLSQWYSAATATLITSKQESFSLVCAESLCCDTPVVGFLAGGPESIALPDASTFVPYGDIDALEREVRSLLTETGERHQSFASQAQVRYGISTMVNRYEEEYRRLLCL